MACGNGVWCSLYIYEKRTGYGGCRFNDIYEVMNDKGHFKSVEHEKACFIVMALNGCKNMLYHS